MTSIATLHHITERCGGENQQDLISYVLEKLVDWTEMNFLNSSDLAVTKIRHPQNSIIEPLKILLDCQWYLLREVLPSIGVTDKGKQHCMDLLGKISTMDQFRKEITPWPSKAEEIKLDFAYQNEYSPRLKAFIIVYEKMCWTDELFGTMRTAAKHSKGWAEFLEYPSIQLLMKSITDASATEESHDGEVLVGYSPAHQSATSSLPAPSASAAAGTTPSPEGKKRNHLGIAADQEAEWTRYVDHEYNANCRLIPEPRSMNTLTSEIRSTQMVKQFWSTGGRLMIHGDVLKSREGRTRPDLRCPTLDAKKYTKLMRACIEGISKQPVTPEKACTLPPNAFGFVFDAGKKATQQHSKILSEWEHKLKRERKAPRMRTRTMNRKKVLSVKKMANQSS